MGYRTCIVTGAGSRLPGMKIETVGQLEIIQSRVLAARVDDEIEWLRFADTDRDRCQTAERVEHEHAWRVGGGVMVRHE